MQIEKQLAKEPKLKKRKKSKKKHKKPKYVAVEISASEKIAFYIGKLVKNNRKLLHINLENTGMNEQMFSIIRGALRKNRSLVSIHFSHNPFLWSVTEE